MGRLVELLGRRRRRSAHAPDLALVEELVARAAGSGLDVTLRAGGRRATACRAEVAQRAYRVVQEGLTNALRYAAGAAVHVLRPRRAPARSIVEVVNGPRPTRGRSPGTGPATACAACASASTPCGGRSRPGRAADGGWRVAARIPCVIAAAVNTGR